MSGTILSGADLSYTQYARLPHAIDTASNDPGAIAKAAQHFESLFIDMWLKSAREANAVIAEHSLLNTSEMKMQQEMLDHEMSLHMARNGGIGLAEVVARQLSGAAPVPSPPATEVNAGVPARRQFDVAAPAARLTVAPGATRVSAFDDPREFLDALAPVVDELTAGLPVPGLAVLSQAALETGWGRRVIADASGALSHNLFGMKAASAEEPQVSIHSKEFELGRWVDREDAFRTYPDWRASIEHYLNLLTGASRYQDVQGTDVATFANGLQQAGYATDPQYAAKIADIAQRIEQFLGRSRDQAQAAP